MGIASLHPSYDSEYDFAISRRNAPGVLQEILALEIRGRGEDRVRAAPAVSQACCKKICCPRAYRFSGEPPAFPAQWLYGLYDFVLVTGFLATIACFSFRFRSLDASTGASDPNDFTVRQVPRSSVATLRPPLPAPRLRRWPTPLVSKKFGRMSERAVADQPPVAGTEPVRPKGDRACTRARDSSGVFLNPNSCKGFEPVPSKEGSG
ncbi:hypothetical protein SAMN05444050_5589 [Afipia sp. GAS231]|nr:hypothetical protein SAMN05444050_5589 [Afipia sp. GAS231]